MRATSARLGSPVTEPAPLVLVLRDLFELADLDEVEAERVDLSQDAVQCRPIHAVPGQRRVPAAADRLPAAQQPARRAVVFDEPSTGLHPLDVATLVGVFDRLLEAGATIIVIDHDLDLLAAADHLIDMGPGGGPDGGHIVAAGTPEDVARVPGSVTGPWLAELLGLPDARQPGVLAHGQRN
jgi:energy-coupling factor transporter ATP-binding protein EcfA2